MPALRCDLQVQEPPPFPGNPPPIPPADPDEPVPVEEPPGGIPIPPEGPDPTKKMVGKPA